MQIHNLKRHTGRKYKKIIGRGGKRGTTSGRGTKGQKARAGHRIRPEIRDMIKKLPKRRGHRALRVYRKPLAINLDSLELAFATGALVDQVSLIAVGLIRASRRGNQVKILADGTLTKPLTFQGLTLSAAAKAKVLAAGGEIKPLAKT